MTVYHLPQLLPILLLDRSRENSLGVVVRKSETQSSFSLSNRNGARRFFGFPLSGGVLRTNFPKCGKASLFSWFRIRSESRRRFDGVDAVGGRVLDISWRWWFGAVPVHVPFSDLVPGPDLPCLFSRCASSSSSLFFFSPSFSDFVFSREKVRFLLLEMEICGSGWVFRK